MKRFFFLSKDVFVGLLILIFVAYFFLSGFLKGLIIISALIVLLYLRRYYIPYRDTLKNEGEIYLSPVYGRVESIRRVENSFEFLPEAFEVRISSHFFDEHGLYLPTVGEMSFLRAYKGKGIYRYEKPEKFLGEFTDLAHTDVMLQSKNEVQTVLRFIDCKYGSRPHIWMKSGDRGRGAACFGYYPFGGTLIIYLPLNTDILVYPGEKIYPGQTVIAALRN
jgi:phosphatidylserine decarboxylase